jgi:hypothetical protein
MFDIFDMNFIRNARWHELYMLLTKGDPPLIVILLMVNTVFFLLYVLRKTTQKHRMRTSTIYAIQAAIVLANAFVIFETDAMRMVNMARGFL